MTAQYDTKLFTEIWESSEDFKADLNTSPFSDAITDASKDILFYLLYARYGNNPIANMDVNQWKFKVYAIIFQYGPTWEKRLDVQKKLRELSDDEILVGAKAIYNHAFNPNTVPGTNTDQELAYINEQNTTKFKKSKLEGYAILMELLKTDVSEEFIKKFSKLFKVFLRPENPLLYETDIEGE